MNKNIAIVLALLGLCASPAAFTAETSGSTENKSASANRAVGLVKAVLKNASRYKDIDRALEDGYVAATGCVSGPDRGAQGVHYVRFDLIGDGVLDPTTPEVLLYEPKRNGRMRLAGAEYLTIKDAWEAVNGMGAPPIVAGQHMFLLDEPNRFVIPPAYALRVWAFTSSPSTVFALNNPRITCMYYDPD